MTASLLREAEAAKSLGISPETLRRWRWSGKGPAYVKLGGAVRYATKDLEEFLSASRRQPETLEVEND
jgi:predicted site-specific integrase-resolvase